MQQLHGPATTYSTTAELTTNTLRAHVPDERTTALIFSTQSGTLDTDFLVGGTFREEGDASALAIVANTLYTLVFTFHVPDLRFRFTPSAAPGTLTIDIRTQRR